MGYFNNVKDDTISVFEELYDYLKYRDGSNKIMVKLMWSRLWNHIFLPLYQLKRGIKNLVIWFPVIWKNDVWDHSYLITLIDKQMEQMEDFFYSDIPCSSNSKQCAKRIRWTRKLEKMWSNGYYSVKAYREHTDIKSGMEKDEKVYKLWLKGMGRLREWWD